MKWHAIFEPAQVTKKGGISAGVAILVREWIGLRGSPNHDHNVVAKHRAIVGSINLPGSPYVVTVVSVYLHDSEGFTPRSKAILDAIGSEVKILAQPFVIAGDFNIAPEIMCRDCQMLRDITGNVLKPEGAGTCATTGGMRNNDYFILSTHMLHAVQDIQIQHKAKTSPHRPVQLVTRPFACHTRGLQISRPERIPKNRIIGPTRQPPQLRKHQGHTG